MNMNTQQLPSGTEVLDSLAHRISDALSAQISNANSPFSRLLIWKEFQSEVQIQLALQDAFHEIWKTGWEVAASFWLLGDPHLLHKEGYSVRNELDDLAKQVMDLIRPAITIQPGDSPKFVVNFDKVAVDKIIARVEREQKWIYDAKHLVAGETNQVEKAALDRMIGILKQAPSRLRGELRKTGYPAKVVYDQFKEWAAFKALETLVLTAWFGFMTYGWHGLAYNGLDSLTRNARHDGIHGGFAEMIISNPATMNSLTWGTGFLMATLIWHGLVKWAGTKRNYLIRDAEETVVSGKPTKVWNIVQRNGVFAASVALAVAWALAEGSGILAHEVQWIYTAQKAHEVWKAIDSILDISDPSSPAGKAYATYEKGVSEIDHQGKEWYDAELNRPGASWVGPAAIAKQYLVEGNTVLIDPTLTRDQTLLNLAQNTENQLTGLSPKTHPQNYTFKMKAEATKWAYAKNTESLRNLAYGPDWQASWGLYKVVYEKWTDAKTPDFLAAKDAFEKELKKYEDSQKTAVEKWWKITGVYQSYIDKVSVTSDAKYKSYTAFDAKIQIETPDLSELKRKVAEVPELEWKTPLEYWGVLKDLVGKPGGISEAERMGIITLVGLRSWVIEACSALFLFLGLMRVGKYYGRPENLLSKKERNLIDGYYEQLIIAIQKAFSWENWKAIFPDHEGISRNEAEYLVRKLIVSKDPTLLKWLPIKQEGAKGIIQSWLKIGKDTVLAYQNILTGNTQTDKEAYLSKLNKVLAKLSQEAEKDKSWLGISLSSIRQIVSEILPQSSKVNPDSLPNVVFSTIVSDMATKLDTLVSLSAQTIEHHAADGGTEISKQVMKLAEWVNINLDISIGQMENRLRVSGEQEVAKISTLLTRMKDFQNVMNNPGQPNFQDITLWNQERRALEYEISQVGISQKPSIEGVTTFVEESVTSEREQLIWEKQDSQERKDILAEYATFKNNTEKQQGTKLSDPGFSDPAGLIDRIWRIALLLNSSIKNGNDDAKNTHKVSFLNIVNNLVEMGIYVHNPADGTVRQNPAYTDPNKDLNNDLNNDTLRKLLAFWKASEVNAIDFDELERYDPKVSLKDPVFDDQGNILAEYMLEHDSFNPEPQTA